ncbi:MAG TPA: c-type cytochrome [Steroidobacteraceae bacterium]|nr:c-type cytochrome [Steroidobacteraceae bacterium]
MRSRLRVVPALAAAGLVALAAAATYRIARAVEVNPGSYQGRTEAAIREFREAVALEPDLAHGKELFGVCAECHGENGGGSGDGRVPVIAGQHVSVLVKQLVDFRHDRRWNALMQASLAKHELPRAQDVLDVAAYAAELHRPPPAAAGDAARRQEGRRIYYRDCESCHGRLAEGDLRTVLPRLAGQHPGYLLRQLTETAAGARPSMDEAHRKRIGALSDAERAAVAEYLAQLSPGLSSVP